jgi:hypothetical protein
VSVALQFERGAAADEQGIIQQGLKRDHDLLPGQRTAGPAINTAGWLCEPAGIHIVTEELSRVAAFLEPRRIDEDSLWDLVLKAV